MAAANRDWEALFDIVDAQQTQEEITDSYGQHIARGDRTQLPKDELEQLIIPTKYGFYMLN